MSRYNDKSNYNLRQKELADHFGATLAKRGEEWLPEENDKLLEGYLVGDWRFASGRECFLKELNRTKSGVKTQLWKLATAYGKPAQGYAPRCRTDRSGTPFTELDKGLIELATSSHGRDRQAHRPARLAALLGRRESEVRAWLATAACPRPTLLQLAGKAPKVDALSEDALALLVHKAVLGTMKKLMEML